MRYRLYTALFVLVCLIPVAAIPIVGTARPAANEALSAAPQLLREDGSFNVDVLQQTTDYLGDHFALRQQIITAYRGLLAHTLSQSAEEDVILGKDGWLFYADTLDDYEGVHVMTERQAWAAGHVLALMQQYCQSQGASFLFTIAPNKNSLYPANMPARYPAAAGDTNAELVTAAIRAQEVAYVDLFALFRQQEQTLYRRGDSHWSGRGAALAADTILAALDKSHPAFFSDSFTEVQEEAGDLYQMLYPAGTALDTDEKSDRAFAFSYTTPVRDGSDLLINTENPAASGSLLMFRDSFGNALHGYLAECYRTATFSRMSHYNLTTLASQPCDTVVVELVERNLDWLLTRPPIFPAPVYGPFDQALPQSQWDGCTVTAATAAELPGYVCLQGTLDLPDLDTDAKLYLLTPGAVYEATPSGEGETPFTAYLPSDAVGQTVTLAAARDGVLYQSQPIAVQWTQA